MRLLIGISVFWLALSMLSDGVSTLLLPGYLLHLVGESRQATVLGLLTAGGLLIGMLIQPVAGALSDRYRGRHGRRFFLAMGVGFILASLALLPVRSSLVFVAVSYVLVICAVNFAQAAQQGFIPDLVSRERRGLASGWKGFMDLGGALLGFIIVGQFVGAGATGTAIAVMAGVVMVTFLLTIALVREGRPQPRIGPGTFRPFEAFKLDLRAQRRFVWLIVSRFLFLLGTYAIGRFFLLFIAYRLGLDANEATEQAGELLAGLTLITVLASLPAGWAADRFGRLTLMLVGSMASAMGALALIVAGAGWQILLFGGLLAVGSAAFAGANWALTADYAPATEAARFFGLANFGTAGAAVVAGLIGPLVDWANAQSAGRGYTLLFVLAAVLFVASAGALRGVAAPGPRTTLSGQPTTVE